MLLDIYNSTYQDSPEKAAVLLQNYETVAEAFRYKDNYVAVNHHGGANAVPVFNKLAMISEKRAFDIQQKDYKDRFSVFSSMSEAGLFNTKTNSINDFLENFDRLTNGSSKIEYLCNNTLSPSELTYVLCKIPNSYRNYYEI